MICAFDLDGTLCTQGQGKTYEQAEPLFDRIAKVNKLFSEGNIIMIYTARGGTTGLDWRHLTETQLQKWGVKYHFLVTNKAHFDLYVCDKAIHCDEYFGELRGT